MKKLILMLILIMSTAAAMSHDITSLCWENGRYKFRATSVPNGQVKIRTYTYGTTNLINTQTLNVTGNSFDYSVPQPVRTTRVTVKVTWSDNFVNTNDTKTNSCTALAITLGRITARNVNNEVYIDMEVLTVDGDNTANLTIRYADGYFHKITVVFPANTQPGDRLRIVTSINKPYTITKL